MAKSMAKKTKMIVHPDHRPDLEEELLLALERYEAGHRLGTLTDADLEEVREAIQEELATPPRPWPENMTMDEAIEALDREYGEWKREKEAKARKQKDLAEETRTQRSASV